VAPRCPGWVGRVLTRRWLDGEGWAIVEQWLDASQITPA
jgi:hypothetical protein